MSLDYSFIPSETVLKNINMFSSEESRLQELRICELAELAYLASESVSDLTKNGLNVYEILSLLSDSIHFPTEIHNDHIENNLARLSRHMELHTILDRADFSTLLLEKLIEKEVPVSEQDFLPKSYIPEKFVYVRNPFADEAYDVFSQDFNDPRVKYAKDFKEALAYVRDDECGFCLLPLEDRGIRIKTVEELIFKGDYKINSVIPVFGLDGNADMKYCLVSKNYFVSSFSEDDDRYLELRSFKDNDTTLSELLCVAEGFGLEVYRVNSMNYTTDEGEHQYYSIILRNTGSDFTKLLIYLTLFTNDFSILGIYKNLE